MTSVALYGFAKRTRDLIHQSDADEIWTVNTVWQYDIPRIDRLFELHQLWQLRSASDKMQDHWEWLTQEHDFPIYTIDVLPEVPNSVRFPVEDVLEDVFYGMWRGDELNYYLTSSVGWMIAYAIYKRVSRIEIYGIEMATGTEYAYQLAGTAHLLGLAAGRGIDVYIPEESKLMKSKLYGYESGYQSVSRQSLEARLKDYTLQFEKQVARMNQVAGQHNELADKHREATDGQRDELQQQILAKRKELDELYPALHRLEAAVQVTKDLLEECDRGMATSILEPIMTEQKVEE